MDSQLSELVKERRRFRLALMDLGSQTFRMVLVECAGSGPIIKESILENCRLGQGLVPGGSFTEVALERAISVLRGFVHGVNSFKPDRIRAVATAAVRNAVDAGSFLKEAERMGIHVDVLSGRDEAALAAKGVAAASGCGEDDVFLGIDVGGASSELVLCRGHEMVFCYSFDFGAVSMTEAFMRGGESRAGDLRRIRDFVEKETAVLIDVEEIKREKPAKLIASGGTATTAASIYRGLETYSPELLRGLVLSSASLQQQIDSLALMTPGEKRTVKGLEPGRSDVIEAGITIIHAVMTLLDFDAIQISDGGLLLGLLLTELEKETDCHVEPSCAGSIYF